MAHESKLRTFFVYTGIWLQHVSAGTGHHHLTQNTKIY
jgi:hypothetical protein